MKIIKSIATRRFILTLSEASSGLYYVTLEIKGDAKHKSEISDGIEDLRVAFFAYDAKLSELEGH